MLFKMLVVKLPSLLIPASADALKPELFEELELELELAFAP
jgi:hypothetical protein